MRHFAKVFCLTSLLLEIALYSVNAAPASTGHFRFRMPQEAGYRIETNAPSVLSASQTRAGWIKAWPENGATNFVLLGDRVVLQLKSADDLDRLLKGHALTLSRTVTSNIFILQSSDAITAAQEAHLLAQLPEVTASYPVMRRPAALNGSYAPLPGDSLFYIQWNMEHRNGDGSSAGVDLNVRAAWPYSTGQGVTIAVADMGVELTHPELIQNVTGAPHFNFAAQIASGAPVDRSSVAAHGTEVAGIIAADLDHARMVGVAPNASLAGWVIFDTNYFLASDEQMMEMYQYQSNLVSVQNHSWGAVGPGQNLPGLLEQVGISNAVTFGRFGRGAIMVRAAGNDRALGGNADDDGYPSDPRVIAVAAVRIDGRVASYSNPGACVLVGAPSGDRDTIPTGLFSTDLLGTDGVDQFNFFPPFQDLSGYVFDSFGFSGTSAAAPGISGIAGLMLAANPNLTYRDVQQILIFSSRHFDFADPDLTTNGAGFVVSHNDGFGVPDAGVAVSLARRWINRPPQTSVTVTATNQAAIPDDGLRVLVTGNGVPANLASIHTSPSTGPHADTPTPTLPLVDFGSGMTTNGYHLTGKGALIQRGTNTFAEKINLAAQAGAEFAVVYNYLTNTTGSGAPGGDQLFPMGATDFVPIPAVFIGNTDGEALKSLFATNSSALARIHLDQTNYMFRVGDISRHGDEDRSFMEEGRARHPRPNALLCEQVGVRIKTDHPLRGDVRITLVSPAGTRSVLQRYNLDTSPGPVDWTYYSTHHFYESSAGKWTVYVSDEGAGNTGTVQFVSLTIYGVPIVDRDRDGLDDVWEIKHFGSLNQGPKDDPDRDGYSNMREQIMGTDPNNPADPFPLYLYLSPWTQSLARLSWPGSTNFNYEVWGGTDASALNLITNVPGQFPDTEWFTPYNSPSTRFFRVRAVPNP